jgi:hypothetical protein
MIGRGLLAKRSICSLTPLSRARYCRAALRPARSTGGAMKCPRCQHENPFQAKFCLECGTLFAHRCNQCGTGLPAGAKFCVERGQSILLCGAPAVQDGEPGTGGSVASR